MTPDVVRLPTRNWSIVAWGSVGVGAVILSYVLAVSVALACLALPVILFLVIPINSGSFLVVRLLLSAFGLVAGLTILWSLIPRRNQVEVRGVLIDLSRERRLAKHIEEIAAALNEPVPSEVYLIADANAFVIETGGLMGLETRRIMGLGLPLLQMLPISQFRAVLAHEFAHFYAGDTRLGPWVYNTRKAMARVYENLGQKSEMLSLLTRHAVVAGPYILLMGAMRMYWKVFMRLTQLISRHQEYRSDELACHIAGSQPLIEGLQNIHKCQAALRSYWASVVLPVAAGGFQPQIADGFLRFMNTPQIAKATSDYLARQIDNEKIDTFDTHPPLNKRIEKARLYSLPVPASLNYADEFELPMISLIEELGPLEASLLKKLAPVVVNSELRPMEWDTAAIEVYVPMWRKQIANFLPFLSTKTLSALPCLVVEPQAISDKILNPPGILLNRTQRDAKALEILSCALALSLLDHGWKLLMQPGTFYLERNGMKLEPNTVVAAMKSGKLSIQQWELHCSNAGIRDWSLASAALS
jgi:heat shock protein HtpX